MRDVSWLRLDIGADEFSPAPVAAKFLTTNDVGPLSGLVNFSVSFASTLRPLWFREIYLNAKSAKVFAKDAKRIIFGCGGEMVSDKLRRS